MGLNYSDVESKRFGMRIYRGQYEDFDIKDVRKIVNEKDFDIIIVRYPTTTIYEHYQLVGLDHCKTVHADSLVYYSAPLQELEIKPLCNNLSFEVITSKTDERLDAAIQTIFSGYKNHYFANPCFDRSAIVEGYIEWAKSYAVTKENGITWLIKDGVSSESVAFQACYYNEEESICDLKLGGVMPNYAKRGIYADLLLYSQSYFKNKGIKTMVTSTQLQNVAVRRVWEKVGFKFDKSYETYHLINNRTWDRCMSNK